MSVDASPQDAGARAMRPRSRTRRRLKRWTLGLTVALCVLYVGYWFYLASELRRFVEGWIEDQRANGVVVEHGTIDVDGFPLTVRADIPHPSITAPQPDQTLSWQAESLAISFPPWDFFTYTFEMPGRHVVTGGPPEAPTTLSVDAESASGVWSMGSGDVAGQLRLMVSGVAARDEFGLTAELADGEGVLTFLAPAEPQPDSELATVDIRLAGLQLPETVETPFGPTIAAANADVRYAGPVLPDSLELLFVILRDFGGQVRIADLALDWGDLKLQSSGALSIDQTNHLAGPVDLRIEGHDVLIQSLQDAGVINGMEAFGMNAVAGGLVREDEAGTPGVEAEILMQDGELRVGGMPVMEMPPLIEPPLTQ